jgi:hypothetical protein
MDKINWGFDKFLQRHGDSFLFEKITTMIRQRECPCSHLEITKPHLYIDSYDIIFKVDTKTDKNRININILVELLQCYYEEFDWICSVMDEDEEIEVNNETIASIPDTVVLRQTEKALLSKCIPYIAFVMLDKLGNLVVGLSFGLNKYRYLHECIRTLDNYRVTYNLIFSPMQLDFLGTNGTLLYPLTTNDYELRYDIGTQAYCIEFDHFTGSYSTYKEQTMMNNFLGISTITKYLSRDILEKRSLVEKTHVYYFGCYIPLSNNVVGQASLDAITNLLNHPDVVPVSLHETDGVILLLVEQSKITEEMSDKTLAVCLKFGYHEDMVIHSFLTDNILERYEANILNDLQLGPPILSFRDMSKAEIMDMLKAYY